jgi:hypothetical protein
MFVEYFTMMVAEFLCRAKWSDQATDNLGRPRSRGASQAELDHLAEIDHGIGDVLVLAELMIGGATSTLMSSR